MMTRPCSGELGSSSVSTTVAIPLPQLTSWGGALIGVLRGIAKPCLLSRVASQMSITPEFCCAG